MATSEQSGNFIGKMYSNIRNLFENTDYDDHIVQKNSKKTTAVQFDPTKKYVDPVDKELAEFLLAYPEIERSHKIYKLDYRAYRIDNRDVTVEVNAGHMIIRDGPLKQPFADYMLGTGLNEEWDSSEPLFGKAAPTQTFDTKQDIESKRSFGPVAAPYRNEASHRLEAMKNARKQAQIRSKDKNPGVLASTPNLVCWTKGFQPAKETQMNTPQSSHSSTALNTPQGHMGVTPGVTPHTNQYSQQYWNYYRPVVKHDTYPYQMAYPNYGYMY
eukprot:Platyproteum_vivax@DN12131_c0_g1_i1.p1